MLFMPFQVLGVWLRGLISLILLAAGIGLLADWYRHRETVVVEPVEVSRPAAPDAEGPPVVRAERTRAVPWQFGLNRETACLLGGLALLGWCLGGGWLLGPRLLRRRGDTPPAGSTGEVRRLHRPDGTELAVELHGPEAGVPVVLVHGWGLDRQEWCYGKTELGGGHRLIVWDLPGLGQSTRPADRDWSLDKLAGHLDAVIGLAGGRPVVLVGHSIGAMIILTYCKLFSHGLGSRVRGLVLAHGTYTNPVRTTSKAALYAALQKPVLEPLCHLMIWLAPLVRVLNGLSYLRGSAHRSTARDSFSGHETWDQLDFITRYYSKAPPDVVARGMLAMFRFDATDVLGRIPVPTLIVTGEQDRTCLPQASRTMAESIPGARLVSLAPAKHCGLFEHHRRFHAAVAEFLGAASHRGDGTALAEPARPTPVAVPQDLVSRG